MDEARDTLEAILPQLYFKCSRRGRQCDLETLLFHKTLASFQGIKIRSDDHLPTVFFIFFNKIIVFVCSQQMSVQVDVSLCMIPNNFRLAHEPKKEKACQFMYSHLTPVNSPSPAL